MLSFGAAVMKQIRFGHPIFKLKEFEKAAGSPRDPGTCGGLGERKAFARPQARWFCFHALRRAEEPSV
jgi:hypothetical protein